jgi:hypothetical protein
MVTHDELNVRFTYHAPTPPKIEKMVGIRGLAHSMAEQILAQVPECRERSLALTKLEEAVMWSNAGIARREG